MVKKMKTEDFEEAVVTRPLEFRVDRELVKELSLFDDSAADEVRALASTPRNIKRDTDR